LDDPSFGPCLGEPQVSDPAPGKQTSEWNADPFGFAGPIAEPFGTECPVIGKGFTRLRNSETIS
jgi:hypothetical protein